MGDFKVRKIKNAADRQRMYQYALNDIEAFETMLREKMFVSGPPSIGAEQELCIVNQNLDPASSALKILEAMDEPRYTNELGLFNLEINLDPLPLSGNCFSEMEASLLMLLQKSQTEAAKAKEQILMTGILPTLKFRHLQFEFMTPEQRYQTLSNALVDIRGDKFEIRIQGTDEMIMSLDSILFEACNTSFQLHLQIDPDDFVNKHNWSQMIAGPVLSACVNSPMLFGNELWAETRIALFKQSIDTRSSQKHLRKKLSRVYFGNDWIRNSAADLWKNDIMRFPLIATSDDFQDAKELLKKGEIPNLRAIRLHNGTTYTWNRLCYGHSKKEPHLRIECRYLPAGPSAIDEIANFAFWIGLMNAEPPQGKEFWKKQNFKVAKSNFVKAARTGLSSVFNWFGKNISAKELILEELLPMAQKGLTKVGVADQDIEKYLYTFEKRVRAESTGSDWMVKNFRILSKKYGEAVAQKELTRQMLVYQKENLPISEWDYAEEDKIRLIPKEPKVEQFMSNDIFSIHENDSIELAKSIIKWNHIHHLPVENNDGDLVGLITDGMIQRLSDSNATQFAKDIMLTNPLSIKPSDLIWDVKRLMDEKQVNGIPVVYRKKLVGILTKVDLQKIKNFSIDSKGHRQI